MRASPVGDLTGRRLYLCTPDRPDLEAFLHAALAGGVDMVQLRDKRLDAGPLVDRAALAARCCAAHGVPFVVNDRPDVALASGAAGVHVGQDDISPEIARRILGPSAIVGLSPHRPAEMEASIPAPVDYVSAGPVEPTPTKPGRPGTGPDYAGYATARAGRPVFVTGGVRPETVRPLVAAGARRFVVVRYLMTSSDVEADARRLATVIDEALAAASSGQGS
ncbi:MAG: thiamine phosphate synthase [Acidobacteriota bacterium]|nr:thiamine phosphate synthase [Acidobacteriota bacterium]